MTVAELIERLKALPAELPVYLADWSEGYAFDHPLTADPMVSAAYTTRRNVVLPKRVVLGL